MKPANLNDISEEELAKVDALKGKSKVELISRDTAFLSELGYYYGFSAIEAYLNDIITEYQANEFIKGGRRMHAINIYDFAIAQRAAGANQAKVFKKVMKPFTNLIDGVDNG